MGLENVDLPVRERGFRREGDAITHVCAVPISPALGDVLFLAATDESDGSAVVWRSSLNATILNTVGFSGGAAKQVPDARFDRIFGTEIMFFAAQMGASHVPSKSVASPAPE
jgi:hypothetical protein